MLPERPTYAKLKDSAVIRPPAYHFNKEQAATEKQTKLARWMAETLKIQVPSKNSKTAYRDFISNNMAEFKRALSDIQDREQCPDRDDFVIPNEY